MNVSRPGNSVWNAELQHVLLELASHELFASVSVANMLNVDVVNAVSPPFVRSGLTFSLELLHLFHHQAIHGRLIALLGPLGELLKEHGQRS